MSSRIHHVNFLVRNLEQAVQRYRGLLSVKEVLFEDLAERGVRTARFRLGDTWIVLVQPVDPEGLPGRRLREQGEGFFLISYATDDLEEAVEDAGKAGVRASGDGPRKGLSGWLVRDLEAEDLFGVNSQLTESGD